MLLGSRDAATDRADGRITSIPLRENAAIQHDHADEIKASPIASTSRASRNADSRSLADQTGFIVVDYRFSLWLVQNAVHELTQ
jgi:hypothetical protein